jgi:hypothetical protein
MAVSRNLLAADLNRRDAILKGPVAVINYCDESL